MIARQEIRSQMSHCLARPARAGSGWAHRGLLARAPPATALPSQSAAHLRHVLVKGAA